MEGRHVRVSVRLGSEQTGATPSLLVLTSLTRSSTVSDVKATLARTLETRPKEDGIVCALGGRVLRDQERLGDLLVDEPLRASGNDDDEALLELNVIVRPSAWTRTPPPPPVVVAAAPDSTSSPSSEPQPSTEAATVVAAAAAPTATTTGEEELPPPVPVVKVAPPPPLSSESQPAQAGTASNDQPQPISDNGSTATPTAGTPYATYLSYLHRLVPIQRALLLLNLQKAHQWYADRLHGNGDGEEGLQEVEEMLKEVGVWTVVEDAVDKARKEGERWERQPERDQEFRVVQIAGLPYLLHTPPELLVAHEPAAAAAAAQHLVQKRRTAAVHQVLTTMLQLVLTLQPSAPAIAYGGGRATAVRSSNPGAHFGPMSGGWTGTGLDGRGRPREGDPRGADVVLANWHAQQRFAPPPPPPPGAEAPLLARRRAATLSVIINVDAILSLFIPLFLLSLKLAFLLFIFGRHASPSKRIALACVAVLWILYEGWSIQRRRAQAMRERERAERERRRANRAAAVQFGREQAQARAEVRAQARAQAEIIGPAGGGGEDELLAAAAFPYGRPRLGQDEGPPPPPAPAADPRRRTAGAGTTTRHRPRRTPPSRLSPKYWLNLIAAVGLVAEARELGLSPRSIAGRPVAPPPPAHHHPQTRRTNEALQRGLRNVLIAVVLFFGTLSPEVERKRRKAIDKRERLLAERRAVAAAAAAEVARMRAMQAEAEVAAAEEGEGASTRAIGSSEPESTLTAAAEVAWGSFSGTARPALAPASEEEGLRRRHPPPPADDAGEEGPTTTTTVTVPPPGATGPESSTFASTSAAAAPPPPPQGRERVSDAELFRDGPSEAYLLSSRPRTTTTGSAAAATTTRDPVLAGSETGPNSTTIADPPPSAAAAAEGGATRPRQDDSAPTPPFEDDDLASLLSTSASSSAPEDDDEDVDEQDGIARRVHARRARMVVARRGGGGIGGGRQRRLGGGGGRGDEPGEDDEDEEEEPRVEEEQIDQVVALF